MSLNSLAPSKCVLAILVMAAFQVAPSPIRGQERPWYVSPCGVLKNTGMYNETMLTLPGLVTVGSNGEMLMHGYDCADEFGPLPLVFGGEPSDPAARFRLPPETLEASTVPLKKDVDYDVLMRLIKQAEASGQPQMLRATLSGRFFAGTAIAAKSGKISHPKARLVISEVELVRDGLEAPVDFSPLPPNPKSAKGCTVTELANLPWDERHKQSDLQRQSRDEEFAHLHDPLQVAARALAAAENLGADAVASQMRPGVSSSTLASYTWTSADKLVSYNVTVSRPYWLLQDALSGDTVIWVVKQLEKISCPPPRKSK